MVNITQTHIAFSVFSSAWTCDSSVNHHEGQRLGTCNVEKRSAEPVICVLNSPPGDSDTRHTCKFESHRFRKHCHFCNRGNYHGSSWALTELLRTPVQRVTEKALGFPGNYLPQSALSSPIHSLWNEALLRCVNHGSPPCLSLLDFSWVSSWHQCPPFSPAVGHCSSGGASPPTPPQSGCVWPLYARSWDKLHPALCCWLASLHASLISSARWNL